MSLGDATGDRRKGRVFQINLLIVFYLKDMIWTSKEYHCLIHSDLELSNFTSNTTLYIPLLMNVITVLSMCFQFYHLYLWLTASLSSVVILSVSSLWSFVNFFSESPLALYSMHADLSSLSSFSRRCFSVVILLVKLWNTHGSTQWSSATCMYKQKLVFTRISVLIVRTKIGLNSLFGT